MHNSAELMSILVNGMDEISKFHETKEINNRIEKLLIKLVDSDKGALYIFDSKQNKLRSKCSSRLEYKIDESKGVLGQTLIQAKPTFYNHIRSEKNYDNTIDNPLDIRLKSQLIYPIMKNNQMMGLLRLSRTIQNSKNYTQNDIALLQAIESYLIKMIYILNNNKKDVSIDPSKVSQSMDELERNIKKTNDEVNDSMLFLANTVHDIRTPANSLYGFLDLLEVQIKDKKLLNFIQNAKQSAEFINTLTDSILERVKYENEVRTTEREIVNSIAFFSSIANIFSANMSSKNVQYLIKIDPSIPKEIKVETIKLKRVIINLIGNAYKFTPVGKMVEFSVTYANKRVRIEVKDTGFGIEESRQNAIFRAFEQAKEDTSIHFGGTGLGLAICSKYVDELGGHLQLKSKVDEGSNFFFDMPLEIVDDTRAYEEYQNFNGLVTIYTDDSLCINTVFIQSYLENCGIPSDAITISNNIKKNTTHLICFEHKISDSILKAAEEHNIKLILFEEKLFSLSKEEKFKDFPIMSKNNYYLDVLYEAISNKHIPSLLIVDDNKLNVQLLESILQGEHCQVTSCYSGEDGLHILKTALEKGKPFDIVFLDNQMDGLSGSKMLQKYRKLEEAFPHQKSIYAVSITGDTDLHLDYIKLYDKMFHKPFKRNEIVSVLELI